MKKLCVLLLLAMVSISLHAQLLQGEGFKSNKGWSLGLVGGAFGIYDEVSCPGLGMNLTISGVYVDLMGWPRAHESSTDVDVHKDEKVCFSGHVGYEFPLTKWLSIIPVVGYTSVKNGDTDGSNYKINKSSGKITNSYYVKEKNEGFDYGGMLNINIKSVKIYAAGTRYGIYGGIGLKF